MTDDQLRQMMLGFDPSAGGTPPRGGNPNPFAGLPGMEGLGAMPGMEGMQDDPMMKMMQQMMGGIPGEGAGGMPSFPGAPVPADQDPYAYLWRIVHAVFALGLGFYIAFATTFTGTKFERDLSAMGSTESGVSAASVHFFWIFATAELLLQSSRFFLEKGKVQQGGWMGTIMGFLPEPYKGYLGLILRYSRIWTTISGDAMVCVFVLGVCAWLRSN
jgi:hypothetical protein